MSDNVNVTPGTGDIIAADEIAGVKHQRVKVVIGADGVNDGDISASNPMPVNIVGGVELEFKNDSGNPLPVSGTIAVSNFPATQPISGTVTADTGLSQPITDTQLRASAVPVSVSSIALPSGASTSALQTSGNASLINIDSKTLAAGQALMAASSPVVIASNQSAIPVTGSFTLNTGASVKITDGVSTLDLVKEADNYSNSIHGQLLFGVDDSTPNRKIMPIKTDLKGELYVHMLDVAGNDLTSTLNGVKQSLDVNLTGIDGAATEVTLAAINTKTPGLGQKPMATSQPVTIANDQSVFSVNAIQTEGKEATYSIAVTGLVVASTPTDIFTISGSATKTIKITRIAFTASQTTAAQRDVVVLKRSTLNTLGNSTLLVPVAHDSTSSASTAVVRSYTANPTVGTLVGNIRSRKVYVGTTTGNSDEMVIDYGVRPSQAVYLRGVNEVLSINLNSITSTGNLINISIEYTEV
jgi:hypothetical protein